METRKPDSDGKAQREIIESLFQKFQPQLGHIWYLISMEWYRQWDQYTADGSTLSVGPIDNSALFEEVRSSMKNNTRQLKPGLIEDADYKKVPLLVWNKLVGWYGLKEDSLAVCRKMVNQGISLQRLVLEVYPIELRLRLHQSLPGHFKMASFSKTDTIHDIQTEAKRLFGFMAGREVRLWIPYVDRVNELLTDSSATLQQQALYPSQLITVEVRNLDGTWPRDGQVIKNESRPAVKQQQQTEDEEDMMSDSSSRDQTRNTTSATGGRNSSHLLSAKNSSTRVSRVNSGTKNKNSAAVVVKPVASKPSVFFDGRRGDVMPGLCGLYNLGNTCYMNSAIQCLSHVARLTQFLLATGWDDEGEEGLTSRSSSGPAYSELVICYAQLMHKIWSGKYTYAYPRRFRTAMATLRQEYAGNVQHDAQEFLSFLLDGLHEALNRSGRSLRVVSANSKQGCESCHNGDDDEDDNDDDNDMELNEEALAETAWSRHSSLNDSVIIESFHGQLKSSLVCPECNKYSTTFDPFCFLSLSVPSPPPSGEEEVRSAVLREVEVTLVPLDVSSKHVQYELSLSCEASVLDASSMLSNLSSIPSEQMLAAVVRDHEICRVLSTDDKISEVLPAAQDSTTQLYVFETPPKEENKMAIPVYLCDLRDSGGNDDVSTALTPTANVTAASAAAAATFSAATAAACTQPATSAAAECTVNDSPNIAMTSTAATAIAAATSAASATATAAVTAAITAAAAATASEDVNITDTATDTAAAVTPATSADDTAKRKAFGVPFFLFLPHDSSQLTRSSLKHLLVPSLFRGTDVAAVLSILNDTVPPPAECLKPSVGNFRQKDEISDLDGSGQSTDDTIETENTVDCEMTDVSVGAVPAGIVPDCRLSADTNTDSAAVKVSERLCGTFTVSVWNKSPEGIPHERECVRGLGIDGNDDNMSTIHITEGSCISVNWKESNRRRIYDRFCNGASHAVEKSKKRLKREEKSDVTLSDCLDQFVSAERLGDNDVWSCPGCNKQQRALKQLTLWRLPPVLIIHLKRFIYTSVLRGKVITPVQFPLRNLDMTPWLATLSPDGSSSKKSNIYDLISVSNHHGQVGAGHYTAYARSREDTEWYCYNDTEVRKISEDQVMKPDAYILIYERRESVEEERESSSKNNST